VKHGVGFYAVVYFVSLCGYFLALWGAVAAAGRLPTPGWWMLRFDNLLTAITVWVTLVDVVAVLIASIPIAMLILWLVGRRASLVALAVTLTLFLVATALWLILSFSSRSWNSPDPGSWVILAAVVFALPGTVELIRKLPSNNRWRGP